MTVRSGNPALTADTFATYRAVPGAEQMTLVERGAPKHLEWYGAFGLLVTLVWLYLEILHLLAKLQSRQR